MYITASFTYGQEIKISKYDMYFLDEDIELDIKYRGFSTDGYGENFEIILDTNRIMTFFNNKHFSVSPMNMYINQILESPDYNKLLRTEKFKRILIQKK